MSTTNTTIVEQPSEAAVRSGGGLYRVHEWENTLTHEPAYGIETKRPGSKVWKHCHADGTALIYKSRETAERHCRWLNDPKGTEPDWNEDLSV